MLVNAQENGYTLSYIFKVHDLQARGFVRWYGVLFIHPHISLVTSSDHLIPYEILVLFNLSVFRTICNIVLKLVYNKISYIKTEISNKLLKICRTKQKQYFNEKKPKRRNNPK